MAGEGLAQQGDRAVRVQGRQDAGTEQRVALVIGNSDYKNISRLQNPVNDAEDMAAALKRSGFKVTLLQNADRKRMNRAIRTLGESLQKGGVGLFYYAGHGVQVGGVNYLVPIGAEITRQYEVEDEAVSTNRVLGMMESAGNRLNMVFLDACRNNPYKGQFRATSQGLAAVRNAPKGSLISYATGAGGVAADGTGRNGIYTRNLLRYIGQPGLELTTMMKRVRSGVQRDTRDKQTPYELSSLTGDFYFTRANLVSTMTGPVTANVPKGPGKSKFSLGRFDAAAKQEEASRNKWIANLQEMKGAYGQVQGYERRNVSPQLKVGVWNEFLSAFRENNPYTSKDDDLRRQAQSRITHWQGEQQRLARLEADRRRQAIEDRKRREAQARRQAEVRRRNREAEERRLADERRKREAERRRQTAILRDSGSRAWRDPITGMEFVKVPGGSFQMGCHANAGQCFSTEKPVRTVRLDGFWMGKYEVTQGQWKRIMGSNPSRFKKGDNYPVEQVSWNDVQQFIRRLNSQSSAKFGLPSEAQWEYACRAGGKLVPYGTANGSWSNRAGNASGNRDGHSQTAPVGSFAPNGLGLHDMTGNLWEWVQDEFTG